MRASPPPAGFDVVRERVVIAGHVLRIDRPRSAEDLIDERDFDADERLPYWADVWPSGRVLAEAVADRRLTGVRVVELGAGLALPSLVAARAGADVLVTDWYVDALAFAQVNAARHEVRLRTLHVDWRDPPRELLADAPFDLILAADVLYETRNVEPLAVLLDRLAGAGSEVIVADPRRPDARLLFDRLAAAGWRETVEEVAYAGRRDESGPVVRLHTLRRGPSGA